MDRLLPVVQQSNAGDLVLNSIDDVPREYRKLVDQILNSWSEATDSGLMSDERKAFFMCELYRAGITPGQLAIAREYILYGPPSKYKPYTLTTQSFRPTPEEISSVKQAALALSYAVQGAYNRGWKDGAADERNKADDERLAAEHAAEDRAQRFRLINIEAMEKRLELLREQLDRRELSIRKREIEIDALMQRPRREEPEKHSTARAREFTTIGAALENTKKKISVGRDPKKSKSRKKG